MLLCTLCLDDQVRVYVGHQLRGERLAQLLSAVEEFLNHFKAVETGQDEAGSDSTFTERFSSIIVRVREAEMVSA